MFCYLLQAGVYTVGAVLFVPELTPIVSLLLLLPQVAVGVRRLHDTGRSGWWHLLMLTIIGSVVLIVWWASKGKAGTATAIAGDEAESYRSEAAQGNADAQFNLGMMYGEGKGGPQDYVQAHKWYNLAAAQGNEVAEKNRDQLEKRMSREQVAEAQMLAREFVAKPKTE